MTLPFSLSVKWIIGSSINTSQDDGEVFGQLFEGTEEQHRQHGYLLWLFCFKTVRACTHKVAFWPDSNEHNC